MRRLSRTLLILLLLAIAAPGFTYDGRVEKKVFTMPAYATIAGETIKNVRVGYESYGTLNAPKDNVILVTHFFTGTSHAAGKYAPADAAPGYWDGIIGSGKPIDTDRFFVISSDTLVNLNTRDPNVTTTGPASVNPDTGKPYGMGFPIVTIRDFVNVQKALLDSLGIRKLHAVIGASMGALQAVEWAAAYPDMVERAIPVIGAAEIPAYGIGWLNLWAAPILLDPKWNKGDYYGKDEPVEGLAQALKLVTLHARHYGWATKTFGRKWATPDRDPGKSWDNKFAIEDVLDKAGAARAKASDANSFLYLVKANQLFLAGHKASLEEGLRDVKAKVLLIPAQSDLLLFPDYSRQAMAVLKAQGKSVEYLEIEGDGGHLDGVLAIGKAGEAIRKFLAN
ncbi:MAG TPA: homoserine O-acetyltransferase [Methylomirabilota bacterium]|jgi:homoserine O-acetyltransferase|nr:homoserine O-acetyltransferase [Methylomirabilota bacterium]